MNTNPQTAFRPVDYEGANQHPDFLCPRCQHGYQQGDGGEYLGRSEFHYLACQRFTRYDPRRIVDAELHGPFGLGVDLTMIVVECDQFALDPHNKQQKHTEVKFIFSTT